ncbi:hypothetical protein LX32DRAFT_318643 [Colletotrichum zoysiae]|uniref:Uncharacterized protein n=1 Tax=Colletotrichum zoysiae TaxID=1216348 RepID=A0AAD9LU77_9PEZI|nr:hypothetical protein LX32DRAFT_318643 [Colletotrichum zoysiae]
MSRLTGRQSVASYSTCPLMGILHSPRWFVKVTTGCSRARGQEPVSLDVRETLVLWQAARPISAAASNKQVGVGFVKHEFPPPSAEAGWTYVAKTCPPPSRMFQALEVARRLTAPVVRRARLRAEGGNMTDTACRDRDRDKREESERNWS